MAAESEHGDIIMIPLFKVRMSPEASDRVRQVLESGYIGQGPKVDQFEQQLSAWIGHPAALTLNSATSGLTLALRLISDQFGRRGEVLAPPITCTATNWPILAMAQRILRRRRSAALPRPPADQPGPATQMVWNRPNSILQLPL